MKSPSISSQSQPVDYEALQEHSDATRDIGVAVQRSQHRQSRPVSWHGRTTQETTAAGVAQPGGFRRHYVLQNEQQRQRECAASSTKSGTSGRLCIPAVRYAEQTKFVELLLNAQQSYVQAADLAGSSMDKEHSLDPRLGSDLIPIEPKRDKGIADRGTLVLMILKGFVGAAVLFLPRCFANGGLALAGASLVIVCLTSIFCTRQLLSCADFLMSRENPQATPGSVASKCVPSYGDIGRAAFGDLGQSLVDSSLVASQLGFCTTYFVFVGANLREVAEVLSDCQLYLSSRAMFPILGIVWVAMAQIRRLKKFDVVFLIADVLIVISLVIILVWAYWKLMQSPLREPFLWAKWDTYGLSLGTAVFTFEGIGMVLPMYEATDPVLRPKFKTTLTWTLLGVLIFFVVFASVAYLSFGDRTFPIVLMNLQAKSSLKVVVQVLYSVAMILTYPVVLYPVTKLLEARLKLSWRAPSAGAAAGAGGGCSLSVSPGFLLRAFLVALTLIVAYVGANRLDNFVAIIGALSCCPLAIVFPAVMHYRLVGGQPQVDVLVATIGVFLMIFSSSLAVASWGKVAVPYRWPVCVEALAALRLNWG
eukprot:TRINITY_DN72906_c0_g1_i1.p1 TRINITY_DN72906_c0_g1~~TRINITY_DN72906_c0_g1_i1.p1  ORF type:complete len:591 (-),score=75.79 TRINITY_DN72906_c0_g1_i1:99-1871(-)